ncbi:lipoprotein-anchoring transpeptidase ErfK/SrfK [Microbacterium resistens]|uniref:Lipoprotein-anchoring transpeptidase ErfK/SrfK n=1 Tax=Microbacterium resistens TaxID=156977 RepID=A0ABU1SGS1_9MICO|nr:L,D-transpeptidase family protein [Microbacterium resistens]MDR6868057.1 lipoprotein-anchoring transpeptidase ErfK/SrfK [Microbacterium resistens]
MTDLATAPDAATGKTPIVDGTTAAQGAEAPTVATDAATPETTGGSDGDRPVQWAPAEEPRKKRHIGRWIAIGAGVLAIGLGATSAVLIAPGVSIAGVPVGGMTAGAAAEALSDRVSHMQITFTGSGSDVTVSGSDLGAHIDAKALADAAFAEHPMWNVTAWMPEPTPGAITLDRHAAERVLRAQLPAVYQNPVDATIAFDPASKTYVATAAGDGKGIDLDALSTSIAGALADGKSSVKLEAASAAIAPEITDADAKTTVDKLNGILATAGFYVGAERTVPIDPAVTASWLTVTAVDGEFTVSADPTAIQTAVNALPGQITRQPVNAKSVMDSSGSVLESIVPGVTGRELGDVSGAAAAYAQQLSSGGSGAGGYELPVKETPFTTTAMVRQIDVNLSTQTVSAIENGAVVDSWAVSTGKGEFATHTGSYTVNWKLDSQNMGNQDLTQAPFYFQPDVKWVMYFNGDEAFHGVYWHSNWGSPMSHGCVGMPEWRAQWLFDWSPEGVEVNVHY